MRKAVSWLARTLFPFGRGNITKLSLVYFFSTLYFYIPVGTLYLQGKGLNYVQINSLWGIIVGTMFLAEIPTGVIADRMGHKRAVNVALGLQVLGEVIYVFSRGYGAFVLAAVMGGMGFAFASGCVEALVYDSLQERTDGVLDRQESGRRMTEAMGTIEAAQRLAKSMSLRGPILSGRLNVHIASENRATVLSLISMFSGVYVALIGLLFGRIADVSVSYALLVMGLVVLTGSLFFRVGGETDRSGS
jgi:MFS family permease